MAVKTIVPKLVSRERIGAYGGPGTGKSSALLSIAARCPTADFYVMDLDDSYERLVELWPEEHDGQEIHNIQPTTGFFEWEQAIEWLEKISPLKGGGPGTVDDWLVLDLSSTLWEWCRDFYNEQVFGKTTSEHFLSKRQQLEERKAKLNKDSGGGLGVYEQNTDWATIKSIYQGEIHRRLLRWPGHIWITAEEQKLGSNEDKVTRENFGGLGVKPRGHSQTPHMMQSYFQFRIVGKKWTITTAKDRGRARFNDDELEDFAKDYLIDIAGWTVKVVKDG